MAIPASSKAYVNTQGTGDQAGIPKMNQPIGEVRDRQGQPIGQAFMGQILWRFLNILDGPPQQEAPIVLGASPTTFICPSDCQILITGGTGVSLQYTRKGTYNLPSSIGYFPLSDGDALTITYATVPTAIYFPC